MSAAAWVITGIIAAAVLGTAAIVLRCRFNQDKARWARDKPLIVRLPPEVRPGEAGDDTIAMLCLCCNGSKGPDCICTADCGVPRCQAADPEEAHRG